MRHHRFPHLLWPAILAAVGAVAVPATSHAQSDEMTPPADEADAAPAGVSPFISESTTPPTTESPTTEPSTPDTTVPAPETTEADEPTPAAPEDTTSTTAPAAEVPAEPAPPAPDETEADDDELESDAFEALPDGVVREISFPVLGPVRYGNDWGNCRDGCSRRHLGNDMLGVRMQPLLAAVDGTVTRVRYENSGIAGSSITVTGADGWRYNYFHVNNDTPGTDDGAAGTEWQISPQVTLGSQVRAGQVIAYMGDSGNAEGSVPHVHFEIRQPDGTPINPYHSLVEAQERQTCETDEARISLTADATTLPADAVDGHRHRRCRPLADRRRRQPRRRGFGRRTSHRWPASSASPSSRQHASARRAPIRARRPVPSPTRAPRRAGARRRLRQTCRGRWSAGSPSGASSQRRTASPTRPRRSSAVNAVFDHNRDQLTDPSVLNVGMTLRLPPR